MTSGVESLDTVLATKELDARPRRPRDLVAENHAFRELARALVDAPESLLHTLVIAARHLCQADTAGISLLDTADDGSRVFRWVAVSGSLQQHTGITLPADFSPCGVCLRTGAAQLFDRPGRHFTYLLDAVPDLGEALVIPFQGRGQSVGTVWILARDASTRYTHTEVEVMRPLADFTAAALSTIEEGRQARALAESERDARRRAEAANDVKDEFLSMVTHELRAPLNTILGWSDLIASPDMSDDEMRSAAVVIRRSAECQSRLVDDLIDMAQSAAGTLHCETIPFELTLPITLAVQDASRPAAELGVTVEWSPPAGRSPLVSGDPVRLQQVFVNLLSNAVRHTPPGGWVRLSIDTVDDTAAVRVADSGAGIAPAFMPHVFDRFTRGKSPSGRRHAGLGLGLSIARDIVLLHCGTIAVESDGPGRGASFTVTLPIPIAAHERDSELEGPAAPVPRVDGVRVLVVDDEADAREVVATTLRRYGAEVQTADSTKAALESLAARPFDVLLADISMPESDGYDLIERVRDRTASGCSRLRTAALTARDAEQDRQRISRAGFEMHLSKPIRVRDLVSAVAALSQPALRDVMSGQ